MKNFEKNQEKLIKRVLGNYMLLGSILVVALFTTQFVVLATVGVKGTEVSRIRTEKEELRLEIDRLRANIDSAKTLGKIERDLEVVFENGAIARRPIELTQPRELGDETLGLATNNE